MPKFKVGDKVMCIEGWGMELLRDQIYVIERVEVPCMTPLLHLKGVFGAFFESRFELYEEKDMKNKFDLKTNRWKIVVNSAEESRAAQEWLFAQGISWASGSKMVMDFASFPMVFTNTYCDSSGIETCGFMYSDASRYKKGFDHEIKLEFTTAVDGVSYPEVESKKDKEIKAVREEMQKLAERLKVLES